MLTHQIQTYSKCLHTGLPDYSYGFHRLHHKNLHGHPLLTFCQHWANAGPVQPLPRRSLQSALADWLSIVCTGADTNGTRQYNASIGPILLCLLVNGCWWDIAIARVRTNWLLRCASKELLRWLWLFTTI